MREYNIAVAGTGYVGLSIATLLAQHNNVSAVDVIPEKVEMINCRRNRPFRMNISKISGREGAEPNSHTRWSGSISQCRLCGYCRSHQLRSCKELF